MSERVSDARLSELIDMWWKHSDLSRALLELLALRSMVTVPREPTPGLLMSMALRADHGLACPGYYDQPMIAVDGVTHARRLEVALKDARKQHEEVVGAGFYRPEREEEYRSLIAASQTGVSEQGGENREASIV